MLELEYPKDPSLSVVGGVTVKSAPPNIFAGITKLDNVGVRRTLNVVVIDADV